MQDHSPFNKLGQNHLRRFMNRQVMKVSQDIQTCSDNRMKFITGTARLSDLEEIQRFIFLFEQKKLVIRNHKELGPQSSENGQLVPWLIDGSNHGLKIRD